ncbi:MAG: HAD hydrolase-like protein [Candidatus Moranbacteria bacterium]|nr:HAD hydrolase-like protein [Candidatus Moranbacteria bacterium]
MKKSNRQPKLIIFDFDGTIADSFGVFLTSVNNILKQRGLAEISQQRSEVVKGLSANEAFKYYKIPNYQVPLVVNKIFQQMRANFDKVKMFPNFEEIFEALEKNDIKLILLTSNIRKNVQTFLSNKKIGKFFKAIHFRSGLFSKHLMIKRIIRKYNLKNDEVILIGDEVRDIGAARKSGIKIVAV